MKILIAYYSRTGYTGILAESIARQLQLRGHTVVLERFEVLEKKSKWNLLLRQVYQYPIVACSLLAPRFRRWWLAHYPQPEDDIQPPAHPDVSEFDHVCIGGPKWCYISYPVARYLRQVKGLRGKSVSAFATFAGPPFEVFELELLFEPMRRRIERSGGVIVATLGLSSAYHELFVLGVFKRLAPIRFGRPLESFSIDSEYGEAKIAQFCEKICRQEPDETRAPSAR
jgi:hypothetical protein